VLIQQLSGESSFGTRLAQYLILKIAQFLAPLLVSLLDGVVHIELPFIGLKCLI
jgi:hypothetical protein